MTDSRAKQPMRWEDYEAGRSPRQGSIGSLGSHVQFEEPIPSNGSGRLQIPNEGAGSQPYGGSLRHRGSRSSISSRMNSMAQAGGPNSFENFARSWTRAATFTEIPQRRPSFFVVEDDEEGSLGSKRSGDFPSPAEARSLLRQQLSGESATEDAIDDEESNAQRPETESLLSVSNEQQQELSRKSFFGRSPIASSPLGSSLGGIYGSLPSRRGEGLFHPSIERTHEAQTEDKLPIDEIEPLFIKVIEERDGKKVEVIVGQSTMPQTIFNSVNIMIGIGLLSLPLALKQAGFLIGMIFLSLAAAVTRYTARLLTKCLDLDTALVSFSDIAWKAYGMKARIAIGLIFTMELMGACIALVILFGDTLDALVPGYGPTTWKILSGLILIPLNMVPLRYLSVTSILGILCNLGIISLIFVAGGIKKTHPGSLREPAMTTLLPPRWSDLPLAFGLLMAPWGGSAVFPNIYRDMRHPAKFGRSLNYTYCFTSIIDVATAISGYLMFGQTILDEVTSNILITKGYPHGIPVAMTVFIAIIPVTKVPLNARPIFVILEDLAQAHTAHPFSSPRLGSSPLVRALLVFLIRVAVLVLIVFLSIAIPGFDTVMGLLGSALAYAICIILPVAFHLKLFHKEIGALRRALDWALIVLCTVLAIVGTVWIFLPKEVRHGLDWA